MMRYDLLSIVLALMAFTSVTQAEEKTQNINFVELPAESDFGKVLINNVWSHLELNDDSAMGIFDALSQFKNRGFEPVEGGTIVVSDTSKTLWVIVPIEVKENDQSQWAVWVPGVVPLEMEMWLLSESENVLEYHPTGILSPYNTRPMPERYFGIPINLDVKGQFFVVFRMRLPGIAQVQFFTGRADHFFEYAALDALYWAVYIGLAAMMVFYSLFLFWITRRREFLIYSFYVGLIVVAALASSELLHRYVWPNTGELGFQVVLGAVFLSGAIACLFIGELLELSSRSRGLWNVLRLCIGIASCLFLLVFQLDIQQILEISMVWGGGLTVFLLSVCLVSAYQGSRIGRLLSCGWAAQLIGISLLLTHNNGWMPDILWLDYSFLFGSSVEMLFFSLAIPLGLRELIFEKDKILEEIEVVSARHEDGLESVARVQQEIGQLKNQLARERQDLMRLSGSYERAKNNLFQAEQKLNQAEKLASLGQLIVGVSADLGAKAGEVNQSVHVLSDALDEFEPLLEDDGDRKGNSLERRQVVSDIRRLFVFVEKGAGAILRMNQALHQYSAGESQPVGSESLAEVFEDVRLIVHGRIRQHRLEVDIDENLNLNCRRSQVERVLGNLLTNASDAINDSPSDFQGGEDEGLIRVSARLQMDGAAQWVLVEVEDSGAGISEEKRETVRQPFMTSKSLHRGTGLGLFTADSILRDHGGRLEVGHSQELGGAKISLWFPVLGQI